MYALFGTFVTEEGKREELLDILLSAADALKQNQDCIHYMVGVGDEPNEIYVYETWTSKQAHDASLEPEAVQALVRAAMPLIAGMKGQTSFAISGGKGV
jgi:quinol monooxygenase YgiN